MPLSKTRFHDITLHCNKISPTCQWFWCCSVYQLIFPSHKYYRKPVAITWKTDYAVPACISSYSKNLSKKFPFKSLQAGRGDSIRKSMILWKGQKFHCYFTRLNNSSLHKHHNSAPLGPIRSYKRGQIEAVTGGDHRGGSKRFSPLDLLLFAL